MIEVKVQASASSQRSEVITASSSLIAQPTTVPYLPRGRTNAMPFHPAFLTHLPLSATSPQFFCLSVRPRFFRLASPNPCASLAHSFTTSPRQTPFASSAPQTAVPTRADLQHLQNGSDIRGVASALEPSEPVTLTPLIIRGIIRAFVEDVSERLGKSGLRVSLGRDSRISGEELLRAAGEGAKAGGASVAADFGLATTPAMFMSTVLEGHEYDAACMLTASHLPPNRNGVKFFTKRGSANKGDVKRFIERAADAFEKESLAGEEGGVELVKVDFLSVYAQHLVELIRKGCAHPERYERPLEGFKIVVDAGNGAAGFFVKQVLAELGGDAVGQFLEPDGMFPNHVPNPEDKKAMAMTIETVKEVGADLGIVFDTDVDRSGFVDARGVGINRNRLIALMAKIVLNEAPGSTIVTDSVTSNGLRRFIDGLGGKHFRYRKGYKNVIDKGIELNEQGIPTELAIETSGHGAMRENYMLDDGAYLAVKIIIEMVRLRLAGDKRGIGGMLDGLEAPIEEFEFRLKFFDKTNYREYGARVVEAFAEFATGVEEWEVEETNYEGFRVNVDEGEGKSGWLLLRPSLHDPLLALNIESEREGGIARIAKVLTTQFFARFDNVDVSKLKERVATAS